MSMERKSLKRILQDLKANKYISTSIGTWDDGRVTTTPEDYDSLLRAYKDWVYVCASKNAASIAKCKYRLYVGKKKGGKVLNYANTRKLEKKELDYIYANPSVQHILRKSVEVEEVREHIVLDLLKKVNPFLDGFSLFETTQLFLELTGNAYWYIVKNKLGLPAEIWVVPSQNVSIVPDKKTFIGKYVYRSGMSKEVEFKLDEIVHFKFPNPRNLFYGLAPIATITDLLNLKDNMNIFENSLFSNNARPEGTLETDDELGAELRNRIKEDWKNNYSGAGRAGGTPLLEKGLKYNPITFPPRELNFLSGRKVTKELVAGVYGVPMSMLGSDDVNLANAYIGDRQYMSNTIVPRLRRIEEGINNRILPIYDESLFIVFDNPVPDDQEFLLKKKIAEIKVGYRTINEYREVEDGLAPVSWGNKPPEGKQTNTSEMPGKRDENEIKA